MITFHGNPDLKCALIRRAQMHREADRLQQRFAYMRPVRREDINIGRAMATDLGKFKGCAIGCLATPVNVTNDQLAKTFNSVAGFDDFGQVSSTGCSEVLARDFGLNSALVDLAELYFEKLPKQNAMVWPEEFARAIPVGVQPSEALLFGWSPGGKRSSQEIVVEKNDFITCLKDLGSDQPEPDCNLKRAVGAEINLRDLRLSKVTV